MSLAAKPSNLSKFYQGGAVVKESGVIPFVLQDLTSEVSRAVEQIASALEAQADSELAPARIRRPSIWRWRDTP